MTSKDLRTSDGLHPFFAVNYLSRYHLTQLLLPALLETENPSVLMMTAKIPPDSVADYSRFPDYRKLDFDRDRTPIQLANHHYAAYLHRAEPRIRTGVVNAGAARTDILRMQPLPMRAVVSVLGPLLFDSVTTSASNVVEGALRDDWTGPLARFGHATPALARSPMVPTTRLSDPSDLADPVASLLSDDPERVNAQVWAVDGGT